MLYAVLCAFVYLYSAAANDDDDDDDGDAFDAEYAFCMRASQNNIQILVNLIEKEKKIRCSSKHSKRPTTTTTTTTLFVYLLCFCSRTSSQLLLFQNRFENLVYQVQSLH